MYKEKVTKAFLLVIASDSWLVNQRIKDLKKTLIESAKASPQEWEEVGKVFDGFMEAIETKDYQLYKQVVKGIA